MYKGRSCVERNTNAWCFAELNTRYWKPQYDKGYRLVYTIKRTDALSGPVKAYVNAVLKHPLFAELYKAQVRVYRESSQIKVSVDLTRNYKYMLLYLTLARNIEEDLAAVKRWYRYFSLGINPLQAVIMAEGYYGGSYNGHSLTDSSIAKPVPFKDWPIYICTLLQTKQPLGLQSSMNYLNTDKWPSLARHTLRLEKLSPRKEYPSEPEELIAELNHPNLESCLHQEWKYA